MVIYTSTPPWVIHESTNLLSRWNLSHLKAAEIDASVVAELPEVRNLEIERTQKRWIPGIQL